ncbi:MAG: hypothetical protein IKN72_00110, partial [Clostridia bacterium]|nr:hypothetical protein [Clostridia bacterium]
MNRTLKVMAMVLSFICLFLFAFGIGQKSGFQIEVPLASPSNTVIQVVGGGSGAAAAPASSGASGGSAAVPASSDNTGKSDAAPADSKGDKPADTAPAASDAMTKAEIVDLFKTSANKIKTESG